MKNRDMIFYLSKKNVNYKYLIEILKQKAIYLVFFPQWGANVLLYRSYFCEIQGEHHSNMSLQDLCNYKIILINLEKLLLKEMIKRYN